MVSLYSFNSNRWNNSILNFNNQTINWFKENNNNLNNNFNIKNKNIVKFAEVNKLSFLFCFLFLFFIYFFNLFLVC